MREILVAGALAAAAAMLVPVTALAQAESVIGEIVPHWASWLALALFGAGYALVIAEERTHLRKSIPMIIAAGVLWALVAISPASARGSEILHQNILEFAELFLFILAAVSFVNTMEDRQVFDVLRTWLIKRGLSLRGVFWATGLIAFFMSPIADNLTTTLVMGAVALSVGARSPRFVVPACINIVVAANAGGAFSPFGDITTLMVWQRGHVEFAQFLALFLPSAVNWLVPALIMSLTVPTDRPPAVEGRVELLPGARAVIALFLGTIAGTVLLHQLLHLPAALGMMTGFGLLHFYGFLLSRKVRSNYVDHDHLLGGFGHDDAQKRDSFDVFAVLARTEWDTLMFFYGVILCVGALHAFGFLDVGIHGLYESIGPTATNVAIGAASAIFDNIPLMAAVLAVSPDLNLAQWLLVTLTTGVGGSMLSVGSAAGVALMGQARGIYTFGTHLRWTWAVIIGYALSVLVHVLLNGR
ncbi:MAG TPA: sodium:proton antiporter NhaD [Gemmatimonadaceae bacterium]